MSMILEIILLIVGLLAASFMSKKVVDERTKDDDEPKVRHKPVMDIYVVQMGDIYYAWENNVKFLFQHEDPEEVAKMLIRKYPNYKLNIHEKLT